MRSSLISWLVFLVLGAGMWFLRYGGILDGSGLDLMIKYGPIVFFVIYVLLVLTAFKDTVYQGVLSVLIPGYVFYWLFGVADLFLIRAIVAGILVGIGQDSVQFIQLHGGEIFRNIDEWIRTGGGDF